MKSFQKTVAILLAAILLLGTTACSDLKEVLKKPTILELEPNNSSQQGETNPTDPSGNSSDATQQVTDPTDNTQPSSNIGGVTLEVLPGKSGLLSGKLLYTITNAYVVTNQNDIPTDGGYIGTPSIWQMNNGREQGFIYPEFIKDDGRFIDDCYLVLVEVSIKSDNAVGDTDPRTGDFDDPYLFRSNRLTLVDMTDTDPNGFYYVTEAGYFSGLWEQNADNDPSVIRLEPGEEKTYTYGFFIGGYKSDGSKTDLSQLCVCNTYGNPDSILVKLGLGD